MQIKKLKKLNGFLLLLASLFLVLLVPQSGFSQSLEFFTDLALKESPLLKRQVNEARSSEERHLSQSIFIKNPTLGISYQNIPVSTWPSLGRHMMSGVNISISQKIAFPWEDTHRKQMFYQMYLMESEKIHDMKNNLIRNVAQTFHNLHFFYTRKVILQDSKNTLTNVVKISRSLVAVNKMNSAQLLKIEADIAILENEILQTEASIKHMQSNMEYLCGTKTEWPSDGKQFLNDSQKRSSKVKIPSGFRVESHPLYKNLKFQVASEMAKEANEKAKLFPDITLSAGYTFRQETAGRDQGEDFLSFKATVPLPVYYPIKERYSISAQKFKRKSAIEGMKEVRLMLETAWDGESKKSENLFEAYRNFENEVLPKYKASYEANLGALASGVTTLLDVLGAYRKYLDISIQQAELFRELQISIANLKYLIAQPTGGSDEK